MALFEGIVPENLRGDALKIMADNAQVRPELLQLGSSINAWGAFGSLAHSIMHGTLLENGSGVGVDLAEAECPLPKIKHDDRYR
jgi:hypothetical protein